MNEINNNTKFKDLEPSTNPKLANQNSKNSIESDIKLDSNSDAIVWELKKEKTNMMFLNYLCVYGLYMLYILFSVWIIYKFVSFENIIEIKNILIFAVFVFAISFFTPKILYNLNLKSFYFTKNNLVIKKHIGKNIILPLGTFYLTKDITSSLGLDINDTIGIYKISREILPFYCFADFHTNIDEAINIIQPYIENYLYEADKNTYLYFKKTNAINGFKKNYIDFNKLDKLREERGVNG